MNTVVACLLLHAMPFSSTTSLLLYLNGHDDESAYKDTRIRKKKKKKKKKKEISFSASILFQLSTYPKRYVDSITHSS